MFNKKILSIPASEDKELELKRENPLEFKLDFDDKKPVKALFFLIAGLGEDSNQSYQDHLTEFLIKEYQVAVIRVSYNNIGLRPQNGATFVMDAKDKEIYLQVGKGLNIDFADNFFPPHELNQQETYQACAILNNTIQERQNKGFYKKAVKVGISISVQPARNEYLNFGVLQAMDILNVLQFIKKNPPFMLEKDYKTIMFGSSHGGYLALLAAKFAPWLIDGVLENSAYVKPQMRFFGLGRDMDYIKECEFQVNEFFEHVVLCCVTKTPFSLDKNSKYYFSSDHHHIRDIFNKAHLRTQANYPKPYYISYHSIKDRLDPAQNKEQMFELLKELDFKGSLHIIKDESEIDGSFIKNLDHGMGMSLKMLIQKELPTLLALKKHKLSKNTPREILYKGEKLDYLFKEAHGGGQFELELFRHN
ncbi:DUF2920 family protein [Campylobacter sp. MIT 97-5078]|uniref:DUF2920 family protein n=1 Tax=Campylobacter sp. MIT 97-5078 TaxID=1548153 RepID=UPI0005145F2F|nr:DUF2920 family protein [Campylobacter sp. MIT 97-5078]KGI55820.1 hypothetical protein LR59_10310 [Campylobacter sp. MIT 97-5078]TQR27835.1 DUF2920 domain-containing protein [Campylobacter sp. MIT 97-5078]